MVLGIIYNEHDPVEVRLYRSAIRSIEDINRSVEKLFPKPPKIESFNVTHVGGLKNNDSLLLQKFGDLTRAHDVKIFLGLSSNADDIQALVSKGNQLFLNSFIACERDSDCLFECVCVTERERDR
jgi:hypothetical protein